jgi:NhaA family Na+:H+ antiporter
MIKNLSKPFKWFFQLEAASGLVLLIAAINKTNPLAASN